MSIFGVGVGGMGVMRIGAGYVLFGMIMFWFGPERVEWVIIWVFLKLPCILCGHIFIWYDHKLDEQVENDSVCFSCFFVA